MVHWFTLFTIGHRIVYVLNLPTNLQNHERNKLGYRLLTHTYTHIHTYTHTYAFGGRLNHRVTLNLQTFSSHRHTLVGCEHVSFHHRADR